jgi:hypothetical protein
MEQENEKKFSEDELDVGENSEDMEEKVRKPYCLRLPITTLIYIYRQKCHANWPCSTLDNVILKGVRVVNFADLASFANRRLVNDFLEFFWHLRRRPLCHDPIISL